MVSPAPTRSGKRWTDVDLQYLADRYGLATDSAIARHLGRSQTAVEAVANRLRQRRTDNFYSASEVARCLGIRTPRQVIRWMQWGWLKGQKALMPHQQRIWQFDEENIVACLRQRPWLAELKWMPIHYFRSVVREEWERDPWYTLEQAVPMLGVNSDTALKYIRRQWLPAEKGRKPGGRGQWIIRRSAILTFLKNDPRPQYRRSIRSEARRQRSLDANQPTKLAQVWAYRCPACGEMVRVTAPPSLKSPQVRESFMAQYVNGQCLHGSECLLGVKNGKGYNS